MLYSIFVKPQPLSDTNSTSVAAGLPMVHSSMATSAAVGIMPYNRCYLTLHARGFQLDSGLRVL